MRMFATDKTLQNITHTTSQLLTDLGVAVTVTSIDETIKNHPDYPSLLCITDALREWGITGKCLKTSDDKLGLLPTPFITNITTAEGGLFVTVTDTSEHKITYSHPYRNEIITQSTEDFIKAWNEVALLVESVSLEEEKDYAAKRKNEYRRRLIAPMVSGFLLLLVCLFAGTVFSSSFSHPYLLCLLLVALLAGTGISVLLLLYEVDRYNPLLKQICSAGGKVNCSAVLDSAGAKLFNFVSWSEIGFFYFAGNFLFLLLMQANQQALVMLAIINALALPYCIYSLYYQASIVKQWCVLCLSIQLVLVTCACLLYLMVKDTSGSLFQTPSQPVILSFMFAFLTPVLAWSFLKPYFLKAKAGESYKHELNRLKSSPVFFETLLYQQKQAKDITPETGIVLGNPDGSVRITKVCNPYCAPCAKAHTILEDLLEQNPEVRVQIIFNATNQEGDPRNEPVNLFLYWYHTVDRNRLQNILTDWYSSEIKDYPSFAKKYPLPATNANYGHEITRMRQWCEQNQIEFTPTIFINGYQLPSLYSPADIPLFIALD